MPQNRRLMPTLPKRQRERVPFETIQNPFYNSSMWRNFRKAYIINHPLCVECGKRGMITKADVVDHIIPIRKGINPYDTDNLQSLCHYHHNVKSGRQRHEKADYKNFESK